MKIASLGFYAHMGEAVNLSLYYSRAIPWS